MKSINFILLIVFGALFITSCGDDDTVPTVKKSIVDVVVNDARFSLLEAAVVHAGIAGALENSTITVFAPTDDAFKAAGFANEAAIKAVDKTVLANILTYHVIGSLVPASAVTSGNNTEVTMLNGGKAYTTKNGSGVSINGAKVTSADVKAENGAIIHIIDAVMLQETKNLVALAQSNPNLSLLVAAVVRANSGTIKVIDVLSGAGPFTLFAPTNDAFKKAGFDTEAKINAADPNVLAGILTYHVVAARVYSTNLTSGEVTTANTGKVTIDAANATVKGKSNPTASKIIGVNIPASNGVVHLIDTVLLP